MGGERVTVMNLSIHSVDAERGLLLVKGAIPGAKGRLVFVRNARKVGS
jgi:large subunit ribosomal protein L3